MGMRGMWLLRSEGRVVLVTTVGIGKTLYDYEFLYILMAAFSNSAERLWKATAISEECRAIFWAMWNIRLHSTRDGKVRWT